MTAALTFSPAVEVVPALPAAVLAGSAPSARPRTIDLRSPEEYASDHLPGAHNLALFDNEERALIGFLYVQRSPEVAFEQGRSIVLQKIEELVAQICAYGGWDKPGADSRARVRAWTQAGIQSLQRGLVLQPLASLPEEAVLLYCWRGGMRSRAVAALLRSLGLRNVVILDGGYRAWRTQVMASLQHWPERPTYVLRGLTGVGKTLVLRAMERLRPGTTVDLEGLAGHRSSLLGMVGLKPCTQKTFDSRLFERLRSTFSAATVYEGESRKVGDVIIPLAPWSALCAGQNIELYTSLERRIDVLIEDYLADPQSRPQLRQQLRVIESRLQPRSALVELLDRGRERELVHLLLERYYDPLYRHSETGRSLALRVDSSQPERAAAEIIDWLEQRHGGLTAQRSGHA